MTPSKADPVTYIAPVIRFDEHNPFQEPITVDDIFYRSEMRKPTAEEVAEVRQQSAVGLSVIDASAEESKGVGLPKEQEESCAEVGYGSRETDSCCMFRVFLNDEI